MEVKPGYKQTEVGVIPEEWDVKSLREVCVKIQDGTHFSPTIRGGKYLYVTSKNIGFGTLDVSDAPRIDETQHRAIYRRCDPKRGDLLLTKDGASTGNAALNTLDEEFSLLSSVALLRFDSKTHDASYFLQQVLSHAGQGRIKDEMSGNAITRLTLTKINRLRYPVCKLAEQRAIATALSDVDALLGALDRLIAKKRDVKQAAMQQVLTGQTRLPGFSGEWVLVPLSKTARRITRGASPRPIESPQWFDNRSTIGWVRISDVTSSYRYLEDTTQRLSNAGVRNSRFVPAGSLIMSICATVGRPIETRIDSCIHDGFVVFEKPQVNQAFLYHVLAALEPTWSQSGQTGSQMNLNTGIINNRMVAIPQDDEEQTTIATVLSDMDAEIQALEARRAKIRDLKQAMMQELLTGKTRLVNLNTEVKVAC